MVSRLDLHLYTCERKPMSEWSPKLVSIAVKRTDAVASGAPLATWVGTVQRPEDTSEASPPPRLIPIGSPRSDGDGSEPGKSELADEAATSSTSDAPSTSSTRHWPTPVNVRQFAAQARLVATLILRDEIDLDKARAYSGVARTVAQAMTTETARARFLRSEPDLMFDDEESPDD